MRPSKFAQKRVGNLNRFYTRSAIGDLLVEQLRDLRPDRVLDLGVGEGSLSVAVAQCWPTSTFVTVDIDSACSPKLMAELASAGVTSHQHNIADVLHDQNLPSGYGNFDLAVCNPPFFKPSWRQEFGAILLEGGLGFSIPPSDVTAELIFMAQNLRSLRTGGTLALITPDGMMTNRRAAPIRRKLIEDHSIKSVIQLPNNSFKDTDAYCFILILQKGLGPSKAIRLYQFSNEQGLSAPIEIDAQAGEKRLDYDFHAANAAGDSDAVTLRCLGAEIRRGSLGSVDIKGAEFPTFHTTNYDTQRVVFHGDLPKTIEKSVVIAEKGDILVARIDRNFHKKVAIVTAGRAAITDCVYRVRIPPSAQEAVFDALRSPSGAAGMKAASKGVSARLLGKADFLDLPLVSEKLRLVAKELAKKRESLSLLF